MIFSPVVKSFTAIFKILKMEGKGEFGCEKWEGHARGGGGNWPHFPSPFNAGHIGLVPVLVGL